MRKRTIWDFLFVAFSLLYMYIPCCVCMYGSHTGSMGQPSLASHTLQSQEKEGLVTMRIASCSVGMQ